MPNTSFQSAINIGRYNEKGSLSVEMVKNNNYNSLVYLCKGLKGSK